MSPRPTRPKHVGTVAAFVSCLAVLLLVCHAHAQPQRGVGVNSAGAPNAGRRAALVIGNAAYKDAPLTNPVNDARAMKQALAELGFEIIYGENLTQSQMREMIRQFGAKIRASGGVGLFYFAGHGVQVKGQNYLIPVGAVVETEPEVEDEGVDVGRVLRQMEAAGNSLNIVILDACRNNPFARSFRSSSNGLASIDAPRGTLLAYATAPGSVASDGGGTNGLYTQELLRHMREPGVPIEDVFKRVRIGVLDKSGGKQVPWEVSSLVGDFYFIKRNNSVVEPAKPAEAGGGAGLTAEQFYKQGRSLLDQEKYAEAEAELRVAARLSPGVAKHHTDLGFVLSRQGKYSAAEASYVEAIRLDPNDAWTHGALGTALYNQKKFAEAESSYRLAYRLDPANADYRRNAGNALYAQEKYVEAETEYRSLVSAQPNRALFHHDLGTALYLQNRFGEAEQSFRQAVRLEAGNASFRKWLGDALMKQKKYSEAEAEFRQAVSSEPNDGAYHAALGEAFHDQQKYKEMETAYRSAARLKPDAAWIRDRCGHALFHVEKYAEAEAEHRAAVRLDANNAVFHDNLGDALFNQKRYREAEAEYRTAVQLEPGNSSFLDNLKKAEKKK